MQYKHVGVWDVMSPKKRSEVYSLASRITRWGQAHPAELLGQAIEVMAMGYEPDTYVAALVASQGMFTISRDGEMSFVPGDTAKAARRHGENPERDYFYVSVEDSFGRSVQVSSFVLRALEDGYHQDEKLLRLINESLKKLEGYRKREAA